MDSMSKRELANFIQQRIKASGFTSSEIAKRCGHNSDRAIRAIAAGQIPVPIDQAARIAEALGCDIDHLIVLVLRTVMSDDVIISMGRAILKYGAELAHPEAKTIVVYRTSHQVL